MNLLEIGPENSLRVNDGVRHNLCALQPTRVRVGCERRFLTVEIDITDAKRARQTESDASVGEELNERNVPEVIRSVRQRADIARAEHVLGRNCVLRGRQQVVVIGPVGPVDVDLLEVSPDGELAATHGPVRIARGVDLGLSALCRRS